jgi:allantoinase
MLPRHNRYDHSPITERKDYSWPSGKRLAFCFTTNIAVHAFGKGRKHDNAKHGEPPKGWLIGGSYENPWTVDLLKVAGYTYISDWPCDDQPMWLRTRSGPILSVPYPVELNDSPQIIHRQHTAREFCDMLVDQFEEMVEQSGRHPLVCNISIHPHTFGYPFRLRPLRKALQHCFKSKLMSRVWKCRPGEIADYCATLAPGMIPGS